MTFQKDKKLKQDGYLEPGGETISSLTDNLGKAATGGLTSILGSVFSGIGDAADAAGDAISGAADSIGNTVSGWFGGADEGKTKTKSGIISRNDDITKELSPLGVALKDASASYETGGGATFTDQYPNVKGELTDFETGDGITSPSQRDGLKTVMIGNTNPIPIYRKDDIPAADWQKFNDILATDPNISDTEQKVYSDIFAAEGGMKKASGDGNTAMAGITQTDLNNALKNGQLSDLNKKDKEATNGLKTTSLEMQDVKDLYKNYFDNAMAGAAKGYNKENEGADLKGSDMLQEIGNDKVASAVGDTLLRNGSGDGTKYIQQAVNLTLPDKQIKINGGYGSETHGAIEDIAANPKTSKIFLDKLAALRQGSPEYVPGEQSRLDYYKY